MHGRYTVAICLAGFAACAQASSVTGSLAASAVLVNGSYLVTATAQFTGNPALIAGGLNLLRVDGAAPIIIGAMHDDGLDGDAVANDGVYTLLFTANSVAAMQLEASAAIREQLLRRKFPIGTIPVVIPSLTQLSPNSGVQGIQGITVTITGKNTHFSQGTTTAGFAAGITVTSLTVNSATSATAVVNVTADAALGPSDVTMTSGLEAATLAGGFTVNTANLTADVYTWHYDTSRTGLNPNETTLTPANVTSSSFGKVAEFKVDGQIDSQILYLHQVNIPSVGMKNVVYFATENDSVYALDADSLGGSTATVLWQKSLLPAGETAATSLPCGPTPTGIMSTPVIDRARNAIYALTMSQSSSSGTVIQRLHALDLTTGDELFGGPTIITATFPGTGGNSQNGIVTFDPKYQHNRAALLETNNTIYTVWSGLDGDCGPYSPWVISYSADTVAQTAALDLAPNNYGGGMWMGGAGPSVDSSGNVYAVSGNGFGGNPEGGLPTGSYNNSMVKLSVTPAGLSVADYFTPDNTTTENQDDADFGSVGALLLPDITGNTGTVHHLAVSGGKDGQLYVVDRDSMGEFNPGNNAVYQQFTLSNSLNFSTPVYFNGTVYVCPSENALKAFAISNALLATTPTQQSANKFGYSGAVLTISSNGNTSGVVWAMDYSSGTLFAYDATNVTNAIYTSAQAPSGRDKFSAVGGHFNTPTVVDGKVYFGTSSSLVVFGLLP
ncbi:MAG TPA: choice-of-anchor X domain-containing protein [Bryobacteraceae bacterium]|nr:choice-of-anchor X domain-containing protein [Bryobacteraceae bacterium]